MKIVVYNLGCKVNQYESGTIKEELLKMGYDVTLNLEPADLYILNTCAVTGIAEKKSRAHIAKIAKLNPNAKVIVCGCASEHNKEQFLSKKNVSAVIGTAGKNKIPQILNEVGNLSTIIPLSYEDFLCNTTSRTRAYLKIQDGCNNFCSYCLIPYVRGRSRSRDLNSIVKEAEELSKTNKEIVLTGINMSDYKIDGRLAFAELLNALKNNSCRIRISSLECNIVDDNLLKTMKEMPNFCPHFHLSMQSGCNRILKLMNRHYTKEEFIQKVNLIRSYFPNAAITTDVIVGFPTETEDDFAETVDTIKKVNFYEMHIFPYSKRDGTVASKMKMVDGNVVNKRVKILEDINTQNKANYISNQKEPLYCLTESIEKDYVIGFTENYIKIYLPKTAPMYQIVKVKVVKQFLDGALGEIT
ncbi:MAG TPA: tRNA (N(6)-L-threonylcarbamoyladenosine(37)-C(2))-methylthiotransferase MtaB [Clostridiales bacterium]|nr:tRNA (N(6)-L-threonylcarbamoyladenosine(37)-C(2))-methylthiotransferase MtaB [Clostridiales bacterium]